MPCHAPLLLGSLVCQETLHCMHATAERVTPADSKLETSLFKMVFLKTRHEIVERGRPAYYKGPETEIAFSNKELIVNMPFSVVPWLVGFKQ